MSPKFESLKKEEDFAELARRGKRFVFSDLVFYTLVSENEKSKIGVAVGKKVSKKAVQRNLVKRRIRVLIRENEDFLTKHPRKILIVAQKEAVSKTFDELRMQFAEFLKKLER